MYEATMTEQNTAKTLLPYVYDDGGRAQYFRAKGVGDCVCRAFAITSGRDYKEVYDALREATGKSPRQSVNTRSVKFKRFAAAMGYTWQPLCYVGATTSVHLYADEFPTQGRYVCHANGHSIAVVDGVVRDTWDSRYDCYGQPRRIYGYWKYNGNPAQK